MYIFLVLLLGVSSIKTTVNGSEQLSTRIISLSSNTTQELTIYDNYDNRIPEWIRFITIAVHSHQLNITLFQINNNSNKTENNSISGRNIGLVLKTDEDNGILFLNNNNSVDINVMIVTNAHKDNDPIPGGCNEEFPLEISPFLRLYDNQFVNRLEYQLANIGVPKGFKPIACDKSQFLIKYDIYAYFLQQNDFTETEYFRAITLMSNESDIKQNAIRVLNSSSTRAYFFSYPGRGIVYNIIATSQQYSSAYIPIVTYDCNDFSQCGKLDLLGLIIAIITGIVGLVVCLRGHYWFQLQMLFFGFIDGSFIGYVLLLKYCSITSETQISIYTLSIGTTVSLLWLSVWKIIHIPLISLLLSGFSLGFIFVATILFTSIGNLDLFQNDVNYWLIMGCTIFLTTLFFLMVNAIVLSVVSTSIVGSYVAVMGIDRFIDGSISYITLNVIKRAVYNYNALNNVPFQNKDIVLSIMWILLSLTGITLQLYNSSERSPFPPPSSCSHPHRDRYRTRRRLYALQNNENQVHCRQTRRSRRFNPMVDNNNQVIDERSPLLYPNVNNLNNGNNLNYRFDPQNYDNFISNNNINGRDYRSI